MISPHSHHRGTDRPSRESELAPSTETIRRLHDGQTDLRHVCYIADETGNPDWAAPDEEGLAFINDLLRPIGLYLYGRKMYATMALETPDVIAGLTSAMLNFARIWQAADKIVYSKSLEIVSTPKTRLEREFDPQVDERRFANGMVYLRYRTQA